MEEGDQVARLVGLGFAPGVAADLVADHGAGEVRRQIDWLPRRRASRNRLGLLRRAIEEGWAEPKAADRPPPAPPAGDPDADRRRREQRERQLRPTYLAAVAELEQIVRRERAGAYAAFEAGRAADRARLVAAAGDYAPRVHGRLLRRFDADASRLEAFAEAFADVVPTFAAWDARRRGETT